MNKKNINFIESNLYCFNKQILLSHINVGDSLIIYYENKGGFWQIRQFIGLCIGIKRKNLQTILVLRNIIKGIAIELEFFLFALDNVKINILSTVKIPKIRKAKLYYLRTKRLHLSKV